MVTRNVNRGLLCAGGSVTRTITTDNATERNLATLKAWGDAKNLSQKWKER